MSFKQGVPQDVGKLDGVFREGKEGRVGLHFHGKELDAAADGGANLKGGWGHSGLLHGQLDVLHGAAQRYGQTLLRCIPGIDSH